MNTVMQQEREPTTAELLGVFRARAIEEITFRQWKEEDCYLEVHPVPFWTRMVGFITREETLSGEERYGLRGRLDSFPIYVKNYLRQDALVLHHRPTRLYRTFRI